MHLPSVTRNLVLHYPKATVHLAKRFVRGSRRKGGEQAEFLGPGIPLIGDKFILNGNGKNHPAEPLKKDAKKWQIFGSLCLERPAVVSADKNSIEKEFSDMLMQIEFEKGLLSDHEIAKLKDAQKKKKKKTDEESDEATAVLENAQDREDKWNEEFERFTPAPRIADPKTDSDFTSLQRKLDKKLYLIVNQKLGNEHKWVFPQLFWNVGEALHETSLRSLSSTCGDVQAKLFSHLPVGIYKYKYPTNVTDSSGFYGAKVFFFKGLIAKGAPQPTELIKEFKWVTRCELEETLSEKYFEKVQRFLFEFHPETTDFKTHEGLMRMYF